MQTSLLAPEQQRHSTSAAAGSYRWFIVALIALSVLVMFIQRISLSVAIIPWSKECHWHEAEQQAQLHNHPTVTVA